MNPTADRPSPPARLEALIPTDNRGGTAMGLSDLAEKLEEYRTRLAAGQVSRIRPEHVDRVLTKLRDKRRRLAEELEAEQHPSEREVLTRKLAKVEDLIEQATWLRRQVAESGNG